MPEAGRATGTHASDEGSDMPKRVQAGSDGQPGRHRKTRGKKTKTKGGTTGGSHAPMTPAEEEAERQRRMKVADKFTADKPIQPPGQGNDPFRQH